MPSGFNFDFVVGHFNTVTYVVLMMIGFYAMTGKTNLVKKLVGMNIFQWSIILFVVSLAAKRGATIPIALGGHASLDGGTALDAAQYVNPLPHVLMLTAIVVGVAITGVALALLLRIYRRYGTLEEDELLERIRHS
jgi:multicomponent Na+:H+ antiporter subunit C